MSPSAFPRLSGADVVKALGKLGFDSVRTRGSHCKLRSATKIVIVPLHKELAVGTLASILRQADIDLETFKTAL